MSAPADALIEIGTEELPPKALRALSAAFAAGMRERLSQTRLAFGAIAAFATPRRLAVRIEALAEREPDREVVRRGPAIAAAFDAAGAPTRAAAGFARSCGVVVEALERLQNGQGQWLAWRHTEAGRSTAELLPELVREALARLPVPRRMRWGSGEAEFVRPVHWIVMLHGAAVIDGRILDVQAGRDTRGHRFHHPAPIPITAPAAYPAVLEQIGFVIADLDTRRERIRSAVETEAARLGGRAMYDDALLEEVTALVEWPVLVSGGFDRQFLRLPAEVLVATLQGHQRYFPVAGPDGALLPAFITIANIDSRDPAQVQAGNERVVRPRLADAAFFWDADRRVPLEQRLEDLAQVIYQDRLGTLLDKTHRVERLAARVGEAIGAGGGACARAAQLSRCDLMTAMVGEFPELQGVMGHHYAAAGGEPEPVAAAIEQMYLPRHARDQLPASAVGQALAIADRADTLVGIFAIGQAPSADKDPYALRRAALGLSRILIEARLDLDLRDLLDTAAGGYGERLPMTGVAEQVFEFVIERLRAWSLEAGIAHDTFAAVLARRPTRPLDFHRRLLAVEAFRRLPAAAALAAANKRIGNILRKAREAGAPAAARVDAEALSEAAECRLHAATTAAADRIAPLLADGRYEAALAALAALREPVDAFFDSVLVMCEDATMRANRLALLEALQRQFLHIADISHLQI